MSAATQQAQTMEKLSDGLRSNRPDIWGEKAFLPGTDNNERFGTKPRVQHKGQQPWYTTNKEYGNYIEGNYSKKDFFGEDIFYDDAPNPYESGSGQDEPERGLTGGSQGSGHGYNEGSQPRDFYEDNLPDDELQDGTNDPGKYEFEELRSRKATGIKFPPVDERYYLATRGGPSKPMPQVPGMGEEGGAIPDRSQMKTGAGKRFMREECSRFWENLQTIQPPDMGVRMDSAGTQILTVDGGYGGAEGYGSGGAAEEGPPQTAEARSEVSTSHSRYDTTYELDYAKV